MVDEFLTEGYQRHNRCRQEHLASLGLPLQNKSVLEVGAGIGDHTQFFLDRQCAVTCIEGRAENMMRLKIAHPTVTMLEVDLDSPAWPLSQYQIVYAYGILYHLRYPADALCRWAGACSEILLLETCVNSKLGRVLVTGTEDSDSLTGSLQGRYCRPSRRWVWTELGRYFPHVYLSKTQPNHAEFPVDWSTLAEALLEPAGLIRAIFVASREELQNPFLSKELLMVQTHL